MWRTWVLVTSVSLRWGSCQKRKAREEKKSGIYCLYISIVSRSQQQPGRVHFMYADTVTSPPFIELFITSLAQPFPLDFYKNARPHSSKKDSAAFYSTAPWSNFMLKLQLKPWWCYAKFDVWPTSLPFLSSLHVLQVNYDMIQEKGNSYDAFFKLLHFLNMLQQTLCIRSVKSAARSQNHDDVSRKFLLNSVFQMQLQSSVSCLCKIRALSQSAVMCL